MHLSRPVFVLSCAEKRANGDRLLLALMVVTMGGVRGRHASQYCQICKKKVDQTVSHTARELATVFSVTFFSTNNSLSNGKIPPPRRKVTRHITAGTKSESGSKSYKGV